MTINDALDKLLKLALNNAELKEKLLATENAKEPMEEFCKISAEYGCEIKIGTNGGATFPIDEWSDAYEQFISSLRF